MTIDNDIILSNKYGEIRETLDLIDRLGNLSLYSICNIGNEEADFIVTKNINSEEILVSRIYLTKPLYLEGGDLILDNNELDLLYNNLINGSWGKKYLIL